MFVITTCDGLLYWAGYAIGWTAMPSAAMRYHLCLLAILEADDIRRMGAHVPEVRRIG